MPSVDCNLVFMLQKNFGNYSHLNYVRYTGMGYDLSSFFRLEKTMNGQPSSFYSKKFCKNFLLQKSYFWVRPKVHICVINKKNNKTNCFLESISLIRKCLPYVDKNSTKFIFLNHFILFSILCMQKKTYWIDISIFYIQGEFLHRFC